MSYWIVRMRGAEGYVIERHPVEADTPEEAYAKLRHVLGEHEHVEVEEVDRRQYDAMVEIEKLRRS